jgi:hypothetical protein
VLFDVFYSTCQHPPCRVFTLSEYSTLPGKEKERRQQGTWSMEQRAKRHKGTAASSENKKQRTERVQALSHIWE